MRLAILVPLAAALAVSPVLAADQSAPPQAGWQRPSPEQIEARHAAIEAERSADIALLLGLRADQKPALDGFLASSHPRGMHDGHRDGHAPGGAAQEDTLAKLDGMSRRIDARDAEAKQRIDATKRFYTSLTPEQQKRFDAMAQLTHGHFAHGDRGDRGEGRHGMRDMG